MNGSVTNPILLLFFLFPIQIEPAHGAADPSGSDVEVIEIQGLTFEMISPPAGEFIMGADGGAIHEGPARQFEISRRFALSRTEVTVGQFTAFQQASGYLSEVERNGYIACGDVWVNYYPVTSVRMWKRNGFLENPDCPMTGVSWNDAAAFCHWLSEQSGRRFRLPTEAEWEYASRAGDANDKPVRVEERAWFNFNAEKAIHPVGEKAPNAWGFCDMHGNVEEWCLDRWKPHFPKAPNELAASLAANEIERLAPRRAVRGGSWAKGVDELRYAYRSCAEQANGADDLGFRILMEQESAQFEADALERVSRSTVPAGTTPLEFTVGGAAFRFVRIPAGEYKAGPAEYTGSIRETPSRRVRFDRGFDISETETTVAQFEAFVNATGYVTDAEREGFALSCFDSWRAQLGINWRTPGFPISGAHPVVAMTLYDAGAFCAWLSRETGWTIRIPTDDEWEYACRAGEEGDYGGEVWRMAWCNANSNMKPHPVACLEPNAWGLYDMHGNAWEWCIGLDEKQRTPQAVQWVELKPGSFFTMIRGGSFLNPPDLLKAWFRFHTSPSLIHFNNGIRLVRDIGEPRELP